MIVQLFALMRFSVSEVFVWLYQAKIRELKKHQPCARVPRGKRVGFSMRDNQHCDNAQIIED